MALAPYFDKIALSVRQVLDSAYTEFQDRLASTKVAIRFGDSAITSEGRVAVELVTNLLARFYPAIHILPKGGRASRFAQQMALLAEAINPRIELISADTSAPSITVGVENVSHSNGEREIYVGSHRWLARLSSVRPQETGTSTIPFGAASAACFAVGELFRRAFDVPTISSEELRVFSTYSMAVGDSDGPDVSSSDLGQVYLIGCGALGGAAVWTLSHTPAISGQIHLVDPESLELSNLQRYILTQASDVGRLKVQICGQALESSQVRIIQHPSTWGEVIAEAPHCFIENVVSAVDSAQTRCAIQACLPRRILNGWTESTRIGLSRHRFADEHACLMCLYLPSNSLMDEDRAVASALGVPGEYMRVRELMFKKAPLDGGFLSQIAVANGLPASVVESFSGRTIYDLYSEGVCGGLLLRGTRAAATAADVPIAFQSALAGVLLTSELFAELSRDRDLPTMTQIDLFKEIGNQLSQPIAADNSGRCICQDNDYINRYRQKYQGQRQGSEHSKEQ